MANHSLYLVDYFLLNINIPASPNKMTGKVVEDSGTRRQKSEVTLGVNPTACLKLAGHIVNRPCELPPLPGRAKTGSPLNCKTKKLLVSSPIIAFPLMDVGLHILSLPRISTGLTFVSEPVSMDQPNIAQD
ncbi:MAG: hypothetical protein F6K24_30615 [Okeania sp. SIO2D1]|nr:hypothetical protein [Okeania sp. SIO2D1]